MSRLALLRPGLVLGAVILTLTPTVSAEEHCHLPSHHAGLWFQVDELPPARACQLLPILSHPTATAKVGPVQVALPARLYRYLLDRPPLAAALINRLDLGLYQAEAKGVGRYWGHDDEGTYGTVELAYQDATARIYYLVGSHEGRLLSGVAGRAVVFLRMRPVKDSAGVESVETTLVTYTRLDNRVLSGLLSLVRPLVGSLVAGKLTEGVETVNRLAEVMRHNPEQVIFEATDPPAFAPDDVAFLEQALGELSGTETPSMDTRQ